MCQCRKCKGQACRCDACQEKGKCLYAYTDDCRWERIKGGTQPASVRIVVPNITDKNRKQLHRALFYYLKSKMEALSFEFVEFVKEFFLYLVTRDEFSRPTTIYDYLGPQYKLALASGQNHVLNLLPGGMEQCHTVE